MAKIILSAEEEMSLSRQIDRIKEIMPDIEIAISAPSHIQPMQRHTSSNLGGEFRQFLQSNGLSYEHSIRGVVSEKG